MSALRDLLGTWLFVLGAKIMTPDTLRRIIAKVTADV